ncbi:MAG: hypothetical protein HQK51_05205 [Oligoflexia bacterium]|nr:hypothetical protein [Oligoflexia bacterium]
MKISRRLFFKKNISSLLFFQFIGLMILFTIFTACGNKNPGNNPISPTPEASPNAGTPSPDENDWNKKYVGDAEPEGIGCSIYSQYKINEITQKGVVSFSIEVTNDYPYNATVSLYNPESPSKVNISKNLGANEVSNLAISQVNNTWGIRVFFNNNMSSCVFPLAEVGRVENGVLKVTTSNIYHHVMPSDPLLGSNYYEMPCSVYTKETVSELRKGDLSIGTIKVINDYQEDVTISLYDSNTPQNIYSTSAIMAGSNLILKKVDDQNENVKVVSDWGIRISFANGTKSCIYPIQDLASAENNAFEIKASNIYKHIFANSSSSGETCKSIEQMFLGFGDHSGLNPGVNIGPLSITNGHPSEEVTINIYSPYANFPLLPMVTMKIQPGKTVSYVSNMGANSVRGDFGIEVSFGINQKSCAHFIKDVARYETGAFSTNTFDIFNGGVGSSFEFSSNAVNLSPPISSSSDKIRMADAKLTFSWPKMPKCFKFDSTYVKAVRAKTNNNIVRGKLKINNNFLYMISLQLYSPDAPEKKFKSKLIGSRSGSIILNDMVVGNDWGIQVIQKAGGWSKDVVSCVYPIHDVAYFKDGLWHVNATDINNNTKTSPVPSRNNVGKTPRAEDCSIYLGGRPTPRSAINPNARIWVKNDYSLTRVIFTLFSPDNPNKAFKEWAIGPNSRYILRDNSYDRNSLQPSIVDADWGVQITFIDGIKSCIRKIGEVATINPDTKEWNLNINDVYRGRASNGLATVACRPYDEALVKAVSETSPVVTSPLIVYNNLGSSLNLKLYQPKTPAIPFGTWVNFPVSANQVVNESFNHPLVVGGDWGVQVVLTTGLQSCIFPIADIATYMNGHYVLMAASLFGGNKYMPGKEVVTETGGIAKPDPHRITVIKYSDPGIGALYMQLRIPLNFPIVNTLTYAKVGYTIGDKIYHDTVAITPQMYTDAKSALLIPIDLPMSATPTSDLTDVNVSLYAGEIITVPDLLSPAPPMDKNWILAYYSSNVEVIPQAVLLNTPVMDIIKKDAEQYQNFISKLEGELASRFGKGNRRRARITDIATLTNGDYEIRAIITHAHEPSSAQKTINIVIFMGALIPWDGSYSVESSLTFKVPKQLFDSRDLVNTQRISTDKVCLMVDIPVLGKEEICNPVRDIIDSPLTFLTKPITKPTIVPACALGYSTLAGIRIMQNILGDSLTDDAKRLLRPYFGSLVDEVVVHYDANLSPIDDTSFLNVGAQAFPGHVYFKNISKPLLQMNTAYLNTFIDSLTTVAHELKHIAQWKQFPSDYSWYVAYCNAFAEHLSYEDNVYEKEAVNYSNMIANEVCTAMNGYMYPSYGCQRKPQ